MKNENKSKNRRSKKYFVVAAVFGTGLMLGFGLIAYIMRGHVDLDKPKREYVRYARNMISQITLHIKDRLTFKSQHNVEFGKKFEGTLSLTIDPDQVIRKINPLIYGANLDAKTEFEMDLAKFAKDTGITNFRFPGGGSAGYRWQSGDFDFSDRLDNAPLSEIKNVVKFAGIAGAKLVIMVNVESGTPQEAAQWVHYMNVQNAHRVDYWEIGNEVYGDWDKAYMTGEEYAQVIKEYSTLMKQVDPTIKIGANWGGPRYNDFDTALMKRAADYFDFVSYHWYPNHIDQYHQYKGRFRPLPEEIMANSMAVGEIVRRAHAMIEQHASHRKDKIEVAFLEWDGSWDAIPSDLDYEYKGMMWSLANGIFYADTLGYFARHGISLANQFCFQEVMFGLIRGWDREAGWGGSRWDGETIRPKGLALTLFARYFGDLLIESQLTGSPAYYKERDWRPDSYTGDVPYVEAYVSKSSDTNIITIVLTNKHAEQGFDVNISIQKIKLREHGQVWILSGPDLETQNDGSPGLVNIKQFEITGIDSQFSYKAPAHSVSLIKLYPAEQTE